MRVRWNDQAIIKQVLDWGAEGVMIPMIVSASEARRAVAACRYPPKGVRGFSPREASNYFHDLDEYMATANQRMIALIQVEHIDAVDALDEILEVPGVDGILIGPADLSFSLGVGLQFEDKGVQKAIRTTIEKSKKVGVPIGMSWEDTTEGYKKFIDLGLSFLIVGGDYDFMILGGTEMLTKLREATGGR